MGKFIFLVVFLALGSYGSGQEDEVRIGEAPWRIHTLFSTECQNYFDWQTVGIMHSFKKAGHPGPITRLLSCTEEEKKEYKGMNLAPTMEVPSMSRHPKTGDWYPAINKPAAVHHWLQHSQEAQNVDWVVILDADMIVRGPIIPWKLGVEKGRPVAAHYGYLIGCDNVLAKLHTSHPELCDKVGGLLAFHIDDLKALAPLWLSKTEEVRGDRAHWATNITGDIYGKGWISEMYGYSFGAAEVGLRHKITNDLMIYPGYTPREGVEPILFHYGLPFKVGNWSFSKLEYHEDRVVYDCGRLFPEPPYPREVNDLEPNPQKRSALMLSIECINTLNEALHLQHSAMGCPKPMWSRYLSFLKSRTFAKLTRPRYVSHVSFLNEVTQAESEDDKDEAEKPLPKIHTLFSTECTPYFDWQTVGFMHSFKLSGQPGNITRLLSCTDEDLKRYKGHNLAPTHYVPSYSKHPLTGDWYPAINKPVAVLHWLNHAEIDAEFIIILDADMIIRGPITPWEFNVARRRPVSAPYDYLIGCHNILAQLHTRNPDACDKVGGVIIMHIDDLRKFAMLWLHKTEEVRADTDHYATNITGDVYNSGWISEMYGYSFGAAELKLRHLINKNIMLYPGYVPEPGVDYRVFHYGLEFKVGTWSFDKAKWRNVDLVNNCWAKFPEPPDPSTLVMTDENARARDLLSIECGKTLNEALYLHHKRRKCPDPNSITSPKLESRNDQTTKTSRKFNRIFRRDAKKKNDHIVEGKDSEEDLSTNPDSPDQLFSSFRIWIVLLWVVSFVGFLALMIAIYSRGGSRRKEKGKHHHKGKRRHSYLGLFDSNGIDRHLRTSDIDAKL